MMFFDQLAKNLLHLDYKKSGKDNIWENEDYYELFVELLISFSKPNHPNVQEEILRLKSNSNKIIHIGKIKRSVKTEDYKTLLNVFDLVIAY
ncbi:hypothetical protein JKA74_19890 [Marivirga sp. S37H4]|uniref:Uncharacterized protein n=1 Tax=Marivirga aurantiaca TaxID=2802615 RepID=A0A934X1Q8_9BACT|nr:hypothetical protein [Marivirga aurantiaca]MBK6267314.1 hypothetical protein [Marivirga aurantiaca]